LVVAEKEFQLRGVDARNGDGGKHAEDSKCAYNKQQAAAERRVGNKERKFLCESIHIS